MSRVYKNKNKNKVKVALLFIAQVILGVLPVILLLIFIYGEFNIKHKYSAIFL